MGTHQLHHTGLLVADMDRAIAFYVGALEGRLLHRPAPNAGPSARHVMGGDSDEVAFEFCYVGFETGAVELMRFTRDPPEWATTPAAGRLPHFGMQVDDVAATVERVVEHGGRELWDAPLDWAGKTVMYVADPDGNAIELFDVGLEPIVAATLDLYPDAAPGGTA